MPEQRRRQPPDATAASAVRGGALTGEPGEQGARPACAR